MKKTSKIITIVLLLFMLLLGVGYAAIQNITLNIAGTTAADPSQSNFKVAFSGDPIVSDSTYVTASITDDINATINVEGLTEKGQIVSAIYTVQNASTDISADLAVSTTNDNPEYFTLSSKLDKTSLTAGEATTLTVTIELTKIPITDNVISTIGIQLTAMPVEPGQEGTSEGINDFSQTPNTLALVTNENIGDYIDLGNNIIGTESTSDDWRILYKDESTVYAILADYLPASEVPESAGLDTNVRENPYSVWSNTDRDTLLNGLKNEIAWCNFTNGIKGATAIGTPTLELLMSSYKIKDVNYIDYSDFNNNIEDYDLYVPHNTFVNKCFGYWLASPNEENSEIVWYMCYNGDISGNTYYYNYCTARPVVALPFNIAVELVDGIWRISE